MSTCDRLDLQTLGSQPIVPKNLPDHRSPLSQMPMSTGDCRGFLATCEAF